MRSFDSSDMHLVDVNWETDQQNHVGFCHKAFQKQKKARLCKAGVFFYLVPQLESHQFQ